MGSINRVVLLGLVGHHPELKISSRGKPYVHLSLATYRRSKDESGTTNRETQWHKIMIWGKNAELCASFCKKGRPLYVDGHLVTYTKEAGDQRSFHVGIVADQIQLIPGLGAETDPMQVGELPEAMEDSFKTEEFSTQHSAESKSVNARAAGAKSAANLLN